MKKLGIFILLVLIVEISFGKIIPIDQARVVAKNKYYEATGIPQPVAIITQEFTITDAQGNPVYYAFNFEQGGFVIVAAESNFYPIIGYSDRFTFRNDNQPANVRFWLNTYVNEIEYVRDNAITLPRSEEWQKYMTDYDNFQPTKGGKAVEPLTANILWDQGCGYNDYCPECDGAACGHCWTGCVATAMGIIMKYWNYPIRGEGSHSYYQYPYGILSADFENTFYMWSYMENYPNPFVAKLLYHCGVSVEMQYGPDGSGAYSPDAIDAFSTYFRYSSAAQLISKSNYTDADWINILKGQLDDAKVVYYAGRDDQNYGHAFVCDGYDDNDYFHFNFGWSGYNNGYYSLDDVGGYHNGQQAGINIYPAESYPYAASVPSVEAVLDTNNLDDFYVNVSWVGVDNAIAYEIFRDDQLIATVNAKDYSYVDSEGEPGDHYYGVRAVYSTDSSLCAYDFVDATFRVNFKVFDSTGENIVRNVQIIFNNDTVVATFGSYSFNDVPFGWNYEYTISHPDYDPLSGSIPVLYKDVNLVFRLGTPGNVEQKEPLVVIYPNPSAEFIYIKGLENFNKPIIEIYSMNGKLVKKAVLFGKSAYLNLSDLKTGVYNVIISDSKQNFRTQIVVK